MSWEAATFAILALSLIAGVVWYERSKPPSQVVALIAALAALAVAARVAFSPIPNVVPTTDITLIAGFALGGPAGFMVGALAALVSNFWLGQGPWTPWQMAGWGLTGLLGAALAALTGRRIGRVGLAAACGLAGFAYGALLDFSLMVTYGGEQSLDRYLALSARGLPFNVAHAAGNVALALVAGPALVRMLARYRSRFEFAWSHPASPRRTGLAAGAAGALALVLAAGALLGGSGEATAAEKKGGKGKAGAISYLRSAQNADGGFGTDPGAESSPAMTGWALLGLEAAGVDPRTVSNGGPSAIAYLRKNAGETRTTGDIERTILVFAAAGIDPAKFGGKNLVARLLARRGGDGSWGNSVNLTAFGIYALEAAKRSSGNRRSASWLVSARNADGGWGFAPNIPTSDSDSTGAVLQALAAVGGNRDAIDSGVSWLRTHQGAGGGFSLQGGPVNSQSTAWAVQGLIAAGAKPRSLRTGGDSPLDFLATNQARDGHYRYNGDYDQTPVWVTGQALQAVAGQPFPLARVASSGKRKKGGAAPVAPATAPPAPGIDPAGAAAPAKKPKKQPVPAPAAPAKPTTPATPLVPIEPAEEASVSSEDDDDELPWAEIAAGAIVLLVAVGGGFMLRRQSA